MTSPGENDSEGIFAVQLEVMGKLLDAEKRKMSLLQSELVHRGGGSGSGGQSQNGHTESNDPRGQAAPPTSQSHSQRPDPLPVSRTIQGEALSRQRQSITRLQEQHDRLEAEYRTAAAGLFRTRGSSSIAAKAPRSQPAIGLRQTAKNRPSLFNLPLAEGSTSGSDSDLQSPGDEDVFRSRKDTNLAASFADIAGRSARLSFVLADSPSMTYKNGRLVSGTLEALVEHLVPTDKHYPDRTFLFAFLLCSRLFVQPHDLMARVSKQFRSIVGPSPQIGPTRNHRSPSSASDLGDGEIEKTMPSTSLSASIIPPALRPGAMDAAKNMVQFLSEWTESFAYDFRDERMMKHLKEVTQCCAGLSPGLRQSVGQVTSVLIKRLATLDKYEDILNRADIVMTEKLSQVERLNDITEICPSASTLAQQLTHIELERLTHIGAEEFIQAFVTGEASGSSSPCSSDSQVKLTRNLEAYVEWFNRLSYLVAMEICCTSKARDRKKQQAKVIEYFIDVASECCQLNNFNSLMAIVAGLNMTPVTRLKKTWSKVNLVDNELIETYSNPSGNFNNYRQALMEVMSAGQIQDESFCVVPFFSLLVKDIYFLNQGMKKQTSERHVNFEKCWQLAKLVTQFMSWKQVVCDYERCHGILNYLMTTPLASEEELFLASFDLEPAESAYEKDRYKVLKDKNPEWTPQKSFIKKRKA